MSTCQLAAWYICSLRPQTQYAPYLVEVSLFGAGETVEGLRWWICELTGIRHLLPSVRNRLPAIRKLPTSSFAWEGSCCFFCISSSCFAIILRRLSVLQICGIYSAFKERSSPVMLDNKVPVYVNDHARYRLYLSDDSGSRHNRQKRPYSCCCICTRPAY